MNSTLNYLPHNNRFQEIQKSHKDWRIIYCSGMPLGFVHPLKRGTFVNEFFIMPGYLPSFFKTQRPRSFEPRHRYYDERKEKLRNLIDRHGPSDSKEAYRARLRHEFRRHRRVKSNQNANFRVIVIFALLVLIIYFLYFKF